MIKTEKDCWIQRFQRCRDEAVSLYARDTALILFLFSIIEGSGDDNLLALALKNPDLTPRLKEMEKCSQNPN